MFTVSNNFIIHCRLGYICPHSYNPADFLVGTLVSKEKTGVGDVKNAQRICDAYLSSDACKEIDLIHQFVLHVAEFNKCA